MLNLSDKSNLSLRILSIDPGTVNLGSCFAVGDFGKKTFTVNYAKTFSIERLIDHTNVYKTETYSTNISMAHSVYALMRDLLKHFEPDWVICESPYLNSMFPVSYAKLTICAQAIQEAVKDHHFSLPFFFIDPSSVKKGVGVKGNDGNKASMYTAVTNTPDIIKGINISHLDEHSIDAIAVGYGAFKYIS
jgi:Holliday junction resolvasome RuvABC endonuclease subunit